MQTPSLSRYSERSPGEQIMERRIGEDRTPGYAVQPQEGAVSRGPVVNERQSNADLCQEGEGPVQIDRRAAMFARDSGHRREEIAAQRSRLEPDGPCTGRRPDCRDQGPGQGHHHHQQQ